MAKASKSEAHYRDRPKGTERCELCLMFEPPHGCSSVVGTISPRGWCKYFERKKSRGEKWYSGESQAA